MKFQKVRLTDKNFSRNSWSRGKIIKTYPGRDGNVSVIDVKTARGGVSETHH